MNISNPTEKEKPVIYPDILWIWEAFCWLGQRRIWGMSSPQFITAEALHAYCKLFGVDNEEDIALLVKLISVLDNEWVTDWGKKEKAKQKASAKPSSGRRF